MTSAVARHICGIRILFDFGPGQQSDVQLDYLDAAPRRVCHRHNKGGASMKFTRRHLTAAVVVLSSGLTQTSFAQSGDEAAVNQAAEELKQAMLKADKAKLEELLSDKLSYGH